ncbi:3',5'-cyclic adenosine monophosphate phosphodiesterase CpdA [Austwickia sp. TVS 96-490-7B]|uniref:TIGR03767 family metallophosphoesterase n=1 Tax=Austwickia sp. TVS 96-490-7B TaxID=2830843 RepID=UPI001C56DC8A|nr:TIGR03767 family metallophosphoesterase [Austwickia sp. TVS 96-490-7B]MBW3087083.1 3',5'-cyclic adenosine monophosphate phosphodiesterase CpdA [Austwickia sp. TVS 96-490-7B]
MGEFSRRTFMTGAGALAGAAGVTLITPGPARAWDRAMRQTQSRAINILGTTLQRAAMPGALVGKTSYRQLVGGPGFPMKVREDIRAAKPQRDDRRIGLASIVQVTDLHLMDAQSPMRVEFLIDLNGSAFRPHESLGMHGGVGMVQQINKVGAGPYTGRTFDAVISTGDNTDNHERIELDWFLAVMSGGRITANTGGREWEGVQTFGDGKYYNVEISFQDRYKKAGFPQIPNFFSRVTAPFDSPGLNFPWFSVFGNHDNSIQGVFPSTWQTLMESYTGSKKFMGFTDPKAMEELKATYGARTGSAPQLRQASRINQSVTPDARRRPFTTFDYIRCHLDPAVTGRGPVGHGFTPESMASGKAYYTFRIAPGVMGVALDSTNRAGFSDGSLDHTQFRWLEETLAKGSSRYYDGRQKEVTHSVTDELFLLFSHHTSGTMGNLLLDPANPQIRHGGGQVVALLQRFPNVLAWVNGHTHANAITPRRHALSHRSFWEINTASHVDFPQHARIIEVVDNKDNSLSLFTTMLEADAPYRADYSSAKVTDLCSVYREFAFNDPKKRGKLMGSEIDLNTELLLDHPFRRTGNW